MFVRILDLCKVTGVGFGIACSFFVCAVNLFGFFFSFYSPTLLLASHQIIIRHVQSVFILLSHVQWDNSWFKMGKNVLYCVIFDIFSSSLQV